MDVIFKILAVIFGLVFVGAAAATVYAMVTITGEDVQAISDSLLQKGHVKRLKAFIIYNKVHGSIRRVLAIKTNTSSEFETIRVTTPAPNELPDHIRKQLLTDNSVSTDVTDQLPQSMTY